MDCLSAVATTSALYELNIRRALVRQDQAPALSVCALRYLRCPYMNSRGGAFPNAKTHVSL